MGPETEFKVGDTVVKPGTHSYRVTAVGERCLLAVGSLSGVEHTLEKSEVTKVPETRQYVVTTERRLPKEGEMYIDIDPAPTRLFMSTRDFEYIALDVVVEVRPL